MDFLIGLIGGVIFGMATAFAITNHIHADHTNRADLIQRGLAEYCATDGRFAFKGECK